VTGCISGTVEYRRTNAPVTGANVKLLGLNLITATDTDSSLPINRSRLNINSHKRHSTQTRKMKPGYRHFERRLRMYRIFGLYRVSITKYTAIAQSIGCIALIGSVVTALLLSGCTNNGDVNPVVNQPIEVTKNGVISNDEAWIETGNVYRVTDDCSIEAHVTWGSGITVAVDPAVTIHIANNGVLDIEDNVTVKLCDGAYIDVGDHSPGTLLASGSVLAPVIFKADTGAQAWGLRSASRSGGIVLGDSANNISLNYCKITGAEAGVYVRTGTPLITNCKIFSCKGDGIYFDSTSGPADSSSFTKNTISDCNGYPLTLPADKLGNFSGEVVFSGTAGGKGAIRVLGAIVEDSAAVWRKKTLPYVFSGMTVISSFNRISGVTIMPGVVCRFEEGACINIGDPRFGSGILIAKGTPGDSVFFVNDLENTVWGDSSGGILVGMESPGGTILEYCSIKNATTGIFVNPGVKVTVSHCGVTGCDFNGMTFAGGNPVDSLAFRDNACVDNAGYGISITADQLVKLSGSGSVARNGKGGVLVTGTEVRQSGTWKKYDAPYIVEGVLDIGSSEGVEITVHPGTEFDFLAGAYIRVGNSAPGTLIAVGSESLPIAFTSLVQGEYWGAGADGITGGGIRIEQYANEKTELSYCKIQNATSGVYVNANVKIQNCIIQNNQYYGIIRDGNADVELISGNSVLGNGTDVTFVVSSVNE
jgi:hypothetical protein